jgi:deoxyadenosine/deoxycytidine kinase/NTP pyrophosphatase (non-canonical NTP hydrolase)
MLHLLRQSLNRIPPSAFILPYASPTQKVSQVDISVPSLYAVPVKKSFHIAIEGPIGVGKTTLARILQEELGGQLLLEIFEENPFLSDFYADRARYAFQTQIFFLLSRYRQQHEIVSEALSQGSLISDYLFAKDRLFAHLNLSGDELNVYERMHSALGERIPQPGLVVHLRASLDVLMNRIAVRDRSYERSMSRQYIADLKAAYERFFASFGDAPVLQVDTTDLDFVAREEDRRHVVGLVRSTLQEGPYQQPLPQIESALPPEGGTILRQSQRGLADLQRFHRTQDSDQGSVPDLYLNYLRLTEQMGELGRELARMWVAQYQEQRGDNLAEAPLTEARNHLRAELADVLVYLLRIANDAGVDLENAYLEKIGTSGR